MIREELTSRYRMYRIPMMQTLLSIIAHCHHSTVQDFLATLSIMERGSVRERMQWVARLYDIDGDGYISVEELEDVIYSVSFVKKNKYLHYFIPFKVFDLMGRGKEDEELIKIAVRDKIKNIHEVDPF